MARGCEGGAYSPALPATGLSTSGPPHALPSAASQWGGGAVGAPGEEGAGDGGGIRGGGEGYHPDQGWAAATSQLAHAHDGRLAGVASQLQHVESCPSRSAVLQGYASRQPPQPQQSEPSQPHLPTQPPQPHSQDTGTPLQLHLAPNSTDIIPTAITLQSPLPHGLHGPYGLPATRAHDAQSHFHTHALSHSQRPEPPHVQYGHSQQSAMRAWAWGPPDTETASASESHEEAGSGRVGGGGEPQAAAEHSFGWQLPHLASLVAQLPGVGGAKGGQGVDWRARRRSHSISRSCAPGREAAVEAKEGQGGDSDTSGSEGVRHRVGGGRGGTQGGGAGLGRRPKQLPFWVTQPAAPSPGSASATGSSGGLGDQPAALSLDQLECFLHCAGGTKAASPMRAKRLSAPCSSAGAGSGERGHMRRPTAPGSNAGARSGGENHSSSQQGAGNWEEGEGEGGRDREGGQGSLAEPTDSSAEEQPHMGQGLGVPRGVRGRGGAGGGQGDTDSSAGPAAWCPPSLRALQLRTQTHARTRPGSVGGAGGEPVGAGSCTDSALSPAGSVNAPVRGAVRGRGGRGNTPRALHGAMRGGEGAAAAAIAGAACWVGRGTLGSIFVAGTVASMFRRQLV